jgi:Flp pilus assembly pilin Flp
MGTDTDMTKPAPRGGRLRAALECARRLQSDARGATAIEYALIAGLIFAVTAGSVRLFGVKMNGVYERISSNIPPNLN